MNLPQSIVALALCATSVAFSQNLPEPVSGHSGAGGPALTHFTIERGGTVTSSIHEVAAACFDLPFEGDLSGIADESILEFSSSVAPVFSSGQVMVTFLAGGVTALNLDGIIFSDINVLLPDDLFWTIQFELLTDYGAENPFGPWLGFAADPPGV